jgi:hypothetical protein
MTYSTPRPGLHVAFDVFDQWHSPVAKAVYQRSAHTRSTTIADAKGTYLVRVYAPKRGDAGKYKLVADFKEEIDAPTGIEWDKMQIPDPPRLVDIPVFEPPCDPFDAKNPTCAKHCDETAEDNFPGCAIECPNPKNPADARFAKCKHEMACNWAAPDTRIDACNGTKPPPPPPPPHTPVTGRVLKSSIDGADVIVWISVGSAQGIEQSWSGSVLRGSTTSPLSGGSVKIEQVNKTTTKLRVHLTIDVLHDNDQIRLAP